MPDQTQLSLPICFEVGVKENRKVITREDLTMY